MTVRRPEDVIAGAARPFTGKEYLDSLRDDRHVYINGESFVASGRDAQCLRELADARQLAGHDVRRLSRGARGIVQQWLASGWIHER